MRYDWDRAASPRIAQSTRMAMWAVTFLGFAGVPLFLYLAVTADWTLAFLALMLVSGVVAVHVSARRVYGVRRPGLVIGEPEPTHAEQVAEAVEAIRRRQWEQVADRAYRDAGGREKRQERAPASNPPMTALPPTAAQTQRPEIPVRLDPRWEWRVVHRLGGADQWVKARCRHVEVEDVKALDGEVVAQLCLTCDTQFPPPVER